MDEDVEDKVMPHRPQMRADNLASQPQRNWLT
jgi:hypothetical protein